MTDLAAVAVVQTVAAVLVKVRVMTAPVVVQEVDQFVVVAER